MNQTKIGNRVVVITGTAPANERTDYREPTQQRPNYRPEQRGHRQIVDRANEVAADSSNSFSR